MVVQAAQDGIVELLRFGSAGPTKDGYTSFWEVVSNGGVYDLNDVRPAEAASPTPAQKVNKNKSQESDGEESGEISESTLGEGGVKQSVGSGKRRKRGKGRQGSRTQLLRLSYPPPGELADSAATTSQTQQANKAPLSYPPGPPSSSVGQGRGPRYLDGGRAPHASTEYRGYVNNVTGVPQHGAHTDVGSRDGRERGGFFEPPGYRQPCYSRSHDQPHRSGYDERGAYQGYYREFYGGHFDGYGREDEWWTEGRYEDYYRSGDYRSRGSDAGSFYPPHQPYR